MKLNSKRFPEIVYEPGEGICLTAEQSGAPFALYAEEDISADEEAMEAYAAALDNYEQYEALAREQFRKSIARKRSEHYETIAFFLESHRDDLQEALSPEEFRKLLPVEHPESLTFGEMIDLLQLRSFNLWESDQAGEPDFVLDFGFNPEITDELLVVHFNQAQQLVDISHES